MSYLTALKQTATYWAPTGLDKYGKKTWATPVSVPCRWEDRTEQILDKRGLEYVSRARVFFGQDIDLEWYLFLGTSTDPDPTSVVGAYEIMGRKMTPDLRNLQQLWVAFL